MMTVSLSRNTKLSFIIVVVVVVLIIQIIFYCELIMLFSKTFLLSFRSSFRSKAADADFQIKSISLLPEFYQRVRISGFAFRGIGLH